MAEQKFTWVPFYEELADKLLQYQDKEKRQEELVPIMNQIVSDMASETGGKPRKFSENVSIIDIDPFTVFGYINSWGNSNRAQLLHSLTEEFHLSVPIPLDYEGVPSFRPDHAAYYSYSHEAIEQDIPNLWKLFSIAMQYAADQNTIIEADFCKLFNHCLTQSQVGFVRLTQGLFLMRPSCFLPFDKQTQPCLYNPEYTAAPIVSYVQTELRKVPKHKTKNTDFQYRDRISGEMYIRLCDLFRKHMELSIPEYSLIAYLANQKTMRNVKSEQNSDSASDTENQKMKKNEFELNTILYGPPGTGKTYRTAIYAVAIIDNKTLDEVKQMPYDKVMQRYNELREKGQIAFTTFHQSYGYEDFIEGIRPVLAEEKESEESANDVQYALKPGVFLEFCRKASVPVLKNAANIGLNDYPTIWKVSLEGAGGNPTRTECMQNDHIRIGWDQYGEKLDLDNLPPVEGWQLGFGKVVLNAFYNRMRIGDIVFSCYSASTIDAIGVITGDAEWSGSYDYYNRVRKVKWLVKGINYDITKINDGKAMTLSTVYALNNITVDDVLNILREVAPAALAAEEKRPNYVFIIDEINRGSISKIFGELITLIEPSKRSGEKESISVRLPYSHTDFSVPNNVYLLGTMNTADRSIALLDTALRRRFSFVEMMPDPHVDYLQGLTVEGLSISDMLENMNRKIEVLYDREHTIGHAYFRPLADEPATEKLAEIFRDRIIPLLQEYFYDDYEKIRLVLGDNQKPDAEQFIKCNQQTADIANLFGNTDMDFSDCRTYKLNPDAFTNIDAYKKI